jgi:putative sigma-54 modulation protein
MQVTVTGRHFEVSPALRSYLDERLNRMHRYMGKIQSAHVTLSAEKHRHHAEIVLHLGGRDFTGKEVSEDMQSAVDRVTEKLEKQLLRFKDKRTTARKRAGGLNGAAKQGTLRVVRADSVGKGLDGLEILEAGDYAIEDLTVDEAIGKLEERGDRFVVFTNRGTDLIHVVYKLPDGNFGVLNLHAAV